MEFGMTYETIDEIVTLLEPQLGLNLTEAAHAEIGRYFWWAKVDDRGIGQESISVQSTIYVDPNEGESYLGDESWEGFTFVIILSDELEDMIMKIRNLVLSGILNARELS